MERSITTQSVATNETTQKKQESLAEVPAKNSVEPLESKVIVSSKSSQSSEPTEAPKAQSTHSIQSDHSLENLRLKNPKFQERADRLDLISHGLQNFSTKLGSNAYALCDISAWGFSYAQQVKIPGGLTLKTMKQKLGRKVSALVGRELPFSIFSETNLGPKSVTVTGSIRNYQFFFGLPTMEVEKIIKQFLYRRGYSSIKDPYNMFAKGVILIENAKALESTGGWNSHCQISLNISMMAFLVELGATDQFFDDLWQGFERHPFFTKFGVFVKEDAQAQQLLHLAGLKEQLVSHRPHPIDLSKKIAENQAEIDFINKHKVSHPAYIQGNPIFTKANHLFRSGPLLAASWKALLKVYHLDENIPFPKPSAVDLQKKLREKCICL
ncbi:MAG: hypothetical protein QNL04_12695 [SAR324 cluster bacterium]|nr:hypothetical protein [SAR324 cluster bacterium]